MALFQFTKAILENKPIPVFGHGRLKRDFTYIDDIVEGIVKSIEYCVGQPVGDTPFYKIYNIGNGNPVALLDFIKAIEKCLNKKAVLDLLPLQPGDVIQTWADTASIQRDIGFCPRTDIQCGVSSFVNWYRDFYRC
jgi:UDP-glucuronate 4-epimerase